MGSNESFAGFSDEQQKRYEDEIQQQFGNEKLEESRLKWCSYSAAERKRILEEGGEIYNEIAQAIPYGPASSQAQAGIARWELNLSYFYEPTKEILLGLADAYNDHPDFASFFQRIHPKLNSFMREAIKIYCTSH